mmetsp:Transcript_20/g.18  ORF Transcript_20/g.18 Transcript_20/m.18 type:complete len:245 (+) Transcript_20:335-1069(+)
MQNSVNIPRSYRFLALVIFASVIFQTAAQSLSPNCPCVRYTLWDDLTPAQQNHASALGYNRKKWNYVDKKYNELEDLYFDALTSEQQRHAEALGYGPLTWTCCLNHFEYHHFGHMRNLYPWAAAAYAELGWTLEKWNLDEDYPSSAYKVWCKNAMAENEPLCFTEREEELLTELCYTESSYQFHSLEGMPFPYVKPVHCTGNAAEEAEAERVNCTTFNGMRGNCIGYTECRWKGKLDQTCRNLN